MMGKISVISLLMTLVLLSHHYHVGLVSSFSFHHQQPQLQLHPQLTRRSTRSSNAFSLHSIQNNNNKCENTTKNDRRGFMKKIVLSSAIAGLAVTSSAPSYSYAVERAVGGFEKTCREEGNCLEKLDIDGAVGWNWGGKDRCDPTDSRCGSDGVLRDEAPTGRAVPVTIDDNGNKLKVTNVVQIDISIGKAEKGSLNIGLYGEACPNSISQLKDFFVDNYYGGLLTTSKLMLEDGLGVQTTPVAFIKGGSLSKIYPQTRLDFGIPSQSVAYSKVKRLSKAPDNFVPQSRPESDKISIEKSGRSHNAAGLLSIPTNGLGYGGSGIESEDEAFASSFQITATSIPSMDNKESRKVVGQIIDQQSMDFLARLSSLPTQKGLKGILPGQNSGPPLVKVLVTSVSLSDIE
mmetsp:Transcript_31554/g.36823  ORF Transcript_31554/g.36823 Transcript_31554/m.36823 type:complete len:405 (-) Transcript_31554:306-1520(-)